MPEPVASDLQAQLDKALADKAKLETQLAAAKSTKPVRAAQPWPESKILTRSEFAALSADQQGAFRLAHGTVTEDSDYAEKVAAEEAAEAARVKGLAEAAVTAALAKVAADAIKK